MDIERRFGGNIKAIGARIWMAFRAGIRGEIATSSQPQNAAAKDGGDFPKAAFRREFNGIRGGWEIAHGF